MERAPAEAADDVADPVDDRPLADPAYSRRQNQVVSAVLIAAGAGAGVLAWRLDIGTAEKPGPGMWPLIVSIAMVVLAAVQLVRPTEGGDEERFTADAWIVAVGVVTLVAYAVLFERVGFEIPTAALLVVWLKVLGRESWLSTIAVSVGGVVALYLVFITALSVSLPHLI